MLTGLLQLAYLPSKTRYWKKVRWRGRRGKALLNELGEIRRYWKMKEEVLDHILWRSHFVTFCEPVVW